MLTLGRLSRPYVFLQAAVISLEISVCYFLKVPFKKLASANLIRNETYLCIDVGQPLLFFGCGVVLIVLWGCTYICCNVSAQGTSGCQKYSSQLFALL